MIIQKRSDKSTYLLFGGKLISLAGGNVRAGDDLPTLEVTEAVWTRLVTAFGAVVT